MNAPDLDTGPPGPKSATPRLMTRAERDDSDGVTAPIARSRPHGKAEIRRVHVR
jgi:hypothetical protein